MPTLVKGTGAGESNANSYASVADADAYFDARPFSTSWLTVTEPDKIRCLIMATMMIDTLFRFTGYKAVTGQALQWPRTYAPDPDSAQGAWRNPLGGTSSGYFAINVIPPAVIKAACEQAFAISQGTAVQTASANAGIREVDIADAIKVVFDSASESSPPVNELVQQLLAQLGSYQNSRGGAVKLSRA